MTGHELIAAIFALCNGLRLFSYLPQIWRVARDRDGARAISCLTWSLWVAANASTALYAWTHLNDWKLTAVHAISAACCASVVLLTLAKRASCSSRPHSKRASTSRDIMRMTFKALLVSLLALFGGMAQAQDYPNKPVRLIVPAGPGGGDDFATRVLAEQLNRILKQPFVVENRPGAGGLIGQTAVLKSPPDGYTLLLAGASMAGARYVNANATYDVLNDFTPISLIEQAPFALVVNPKLPVKDVREFIAHAKAQAGNVTYGTLGRGQMPFWAAALFNLRAGIQATEIQYKGVSEATVDVIAGRLDYLFLPLVSAIASKDKLSLLAVTTATRSESAPDVPAIAEVLPGYDMPAWRSIMGPAGIPKSTVEILNKAIAQAIAAPELRERYIKAGSTPMSGTPEELHNRFQDSIEIYARISKDAGIKPEQ